MKLELHVHTKYSKDSFLCFWPLYLKCRIRRIRCIAITEHNNINGGVQFKKFCEKRKGKIQVIIGEEIFTNEGEIIGLFLKKNILPGMSVEDTICEIRRQGGVVYVPHPYDQKRKKTVLNESAIERNRLVIDCIEIHNGRNISKDYDIEQKRMAIKYGILPVIGSDAHTLLEIGRNYIRVDSTNSPQNRREFMDALNECSYHSMACIGFAHKITVIVKFVKLLGAKNINEIYKAFIDRIKRNKQEVGR